MKLFLALALIFLNSCANAPKREDKMQTKEIFVLGSLHGYMLKSSGFSLHDFVAAIDSFKPQLVLTEVRAGHPGPLDGSIDGGIEQSIVYAYGQSTNVPVVAVDWFDDGFLAEMAGENAQTNPEYEKQATPPSKKYTELIKQGSYLEIQ